MQPVNQVLDEVRDLFQKVVGKPAPEIQPASYVAFPPGVDPLNHAIHEVGELKRLSEQMAFAPGPAAWTPAADVFTTKEAYVVRLEIPGVDRKALKVFVQGAECVVRGDRKPTVEAGAEMQPLTVERPWGPFERRFLMPPGSHADKVTARCADGVLELRVTFDGYDTPRDLNVEVS
jgi:HSP20 family protein